MEPVFALTMFTPAEAASITGISPDLQRDWRRRGYLPATQGHARFDAFDLSRMLAMKLLADRGIGPAQTHELAEWCALGIFQQAISEFDAWEGPIDRAPVKSPKSESDFEGRFAHLSGNERRTILAIEINHEWWTRISSYLRNSLFLQLGKPIITMGSYFAWLPNGEHHFDVSLDSIFESQIRMDGAAVILDFRPLASLLIERAGRSLCHVEWEESTE